VSAHKMWFKFFAALSTQDVLSGHNNMITSSRFILHLWGQGLGVT